MKIFVSCIALIMSSWYCLGQSMFYLTTQDTSVIVSVGRMSNSDNTSIVFISDLRIGKQVATTRFIIGVNGEYYVETQHQEDWDQRNDLPKPVHFFVEFIVKKITITNGVPFNSECQHGEQAVIVNIELE